MNYHKQRQNRGSSRRVSSGRAATGRALRAAASVWDSSKWGWGVAASGSSMARKGGKGERKLHGAKYEAGPGSSEENLA